MNKNIIALGFVSFFTDMASSLITSILPIYIVYILNEGVDKLGFVVAVSTVVSYGFRVLFGYLSDRYNSTKPFLIIGYSISAITKPLLALSFNWQQIAILRGTERMGKAIRSASKDSLISAYSGTKSGKTFGFHKTMDIAGELSGSIIAFLILFYIGKSGEIFRYIFAFTFIPGILSVLIVFFFVKDAYHIKKNIKFDISKDYSILPILFVYFGFVFFMFNDSFFMIKAKEVGFSITYIPLLVVLLNLVQTLLSYFTGIKIDKIGAKNMLFLSFISGIFSMLCLYLGYIILSFILLGIFTIASLNSIRSYISINAFNKGTIYGIFYGGVAISASLGAVVIGLLWSHFSQNFVFLFSSIGLFIMIILSFKIIHQNKNQSARFSN
jgi:MFS family permease